MCFFSMFICSCIAVRCVTLSNVLSTLSLYYFSVSLSISVSLSVVESFLKWKHWLIDKLSISYRYFVNLFAFVHCYRRRMVSVTVSILMAAGENRIIFADNVIIRPMMSPPLIGGGIKRCFCLTSVCLSVSYMGPKSKTERPRKTKIGTEIAHITRDSDTTFKAKRSKVKVTRPLYSARP